MTKNVYQCIAEVQKQVAQTGIAKNKSNAQQGYKFRGIDDVYNALSLVLAEVGLVVITRCIEREQVERATKSGSPLFYTTLKVEYDFVSSHDGSKHTAVAYGEAMDSADKSTNKAMSASYKYAMFQTFCIPTEAQDADDVTHDVAPKSEAVTISVDEVLVGLATLKSPDECRNYYKALPKSVQSQVTDNFINRVKQLEDKA
jgi:hypothetical protein